MKVHDEVCGMTIEAERAVASVEFQGKAYYFCSEQCDEAFDRHPERYIPVQDDEGELAGDGQHH